MPRRSKRTARKTRKWPYVYPRINAKGKVTSWRVDCGGKPRLRFHFKTRAEADGKADLLRNQRLNEGRAVLDFSGPDRIDAQAALELLQPAGATLRQAAEFYLRHLTIIQSQRTPAQVLVELLEIKAKDESSARYINDLRQKLESFAKERHFQNRGYTKSPGTSWSAGFTAWTSQRSLARITPGR